MGTMDLITTLVCLIVTATACQGLEFHLDSTAAGIPSWRAGCGVLLCEDKTGTGGDTTRSSANGNSDDSSATPPATTTTTITSMTIFKRAQRPLAPGTKSPRSAPDELVATLTPKQPSVKRASSTGVQIEGVLTADRAFLRLELVKQSDCRAEYTCEVKAVDAQGRQLERSSHLLTRPEMAGRDWGETAALPREEAFQILALVKEMDTKLAVANEKIGFLEKSLGDKVESLDDNVRSFEKKLGSFERRLEDKIATLDKSLQDKVEASKNRLEDKIENQVVEKLCDLDAKVSGAGGGQVSNRSEEGVVKGLQENVAHIQRQLVKLQEDTLGSVQLVTTRIDRNLNRTKNMVSSMTKTLSDAHHVEKIYNLSFETLEQSVDRTAKTVKTLAEDMGEGYLSLQDTWRANFLQLESNLNASAAKAISRVNELLPNLRGVGTVTDLLAPKACERGMPLALFTSHFPYAVICQAGSQTGLDFPVLCDTLTDDGGWIVIQRRASGDVNFHRSWEDYKKGFGSLAGDFWLGNEKIHALTSSGTYELRIDLKYGGKSAYAFYSTFAIDDEANKYTLRLGSYRGTAGDSLTKVHNGKHFSTLDRDNDTYKKSCAKTHFGGWWFRDCDTSNLNGRWGHTKDKGVEWDAFTGSGSRSVSFSEMKIRRV